MKIIIQLNSILIRKMKGGIKKMVKTKKVKTTKPRTITPNERVLLRYLLNEKNPMDMNSIMSGTNLTWNEINTANTNLKSNK